MIKPKPKHRAAPAPKAHPKDRPDAPTHHLVEDEPTPALEDGSEPHDEPARPEFDQYYPGGVMKQMADLAGVEIQFNQNVPGGVMEQLRAATTPDLELSQHGPGGPAGQIGYEIIGEPLPPEPPTGGEGLPEPGLPGPQPRAAGVTSQDAITITFDAQLAADVPAPEDFLVMAGATALDPDFVAVGADLVTLTFEEDLPVGPDLMSVGYTPGAVPLTGKDGTPVAKFSNLEVASA